MDSKTVARLLKSNRALGIAPGILRQETLALETCVNRPEFLCKESGAEWLLLEVLGVRVKRARSLDPLFPRGKTAVQGIGKRGN